MIPGADQDAGGSWIKDNGRTFTPTTTAPATDAARQWSGYGTALKPATEIICVARKPLIGTVAANVLAHGCGALNIDGCRIPGDGDHVRGHVSTGETRNVFGKQAASFVATDSPLGRWPANLILSYPEDEYLLRPDITTEQRQELFRWLSENA
jgi:site-specific DNA-methyltransferase (adenine-specific)